MTTDDRFDLYLEYRYLIDNVVQKYSTDKLDYETLYDAGISGLFSAIDEYECNIKQRDMKDFKIFALFHIKSAINEVLNKD